MNTIQRLLVTAQIPHPPLRGSRVPVAHGCGGPNRPWARRAFPQEGKENREFPSPLGRGQGEGPEQFRDINDGRRTGNLAPVYKAVVLSPHWDDAVFSAGGHMAHLQKEGRVLVLNLFTGFLQNGKVREAAEVDVRAAEERSAAAQLGFESRSLGEQDAVYRETGYQAIARLFGDPLPSDVARLPGIRTRLNNILSTISFESLYIPLAVGWHVDHQLTHLAAQDWWDDARTLFYEDMPYALIPHFTIYRLRELGILPESEGTFWSAALRAARGFARMAPIQNRPIATRWGAGLAAGLFLARQLATHRRRWVRQGPPWNSVVESISDTADRKREAAFRYASQVRIFFQGESDWKAQFESAALGQIERFWKKE